jgi:hypothetical protein
MTCTIPTWIYRCEPTTLADATVEFTEYYVGNQTVDYTIRLPWGDTRELSLVINDKKTYNDPYSNLIWSIVASEYDTIEDRVNVVCCHEEMQLATHVLTLYFKPWSWTNIDGALGDLASDTAEIAGELSNTFSGVSGHEYVGHEIVYEKPECSSDKLIGIKIYLYSDDTAAPQLVPALVAVLVLAIFFATLGKYVIYKISDIYNVYVSEYPVLVNEYTSVYGDYNVILMENEYNKVLLNTSTEDDYVNVLTNKIDMLRESYEFTPKVHNGFLNDAIAKIEDALEQYHNDSDFGKLHNTILDTIEEHNEDREEETVVVYPDNPPIDPDITKTLDEMLTYLIYGGMAVGALLLSQIAITTTDTFRR